MRAARSSKTSVPAGGTMGRPLVMMCHRSSPRGLHPKETFGFACDKVRTSLFRTKVAGWRSCSAICLSNDVIMSASDVLPRSRCAGNANANFRCKLYNVSAYMASWLRSVISHGSSEVWYSSQGCRASCFQVCQGSIPLEAKESIARAVLMRCR